MKPLRVLDLFSGIGGVSLGLESTGGFVTVGFCEIEDFPAAVLEERWPGVPLYRDVRELDAKGMSVDVVAGGFPCQDVSLAGKGAGIEGERSGLWREMFRIICECRPSWVVAENVPALRTRGADRVLSDLEGAGYSCWPVVVGADHAGAPHRRRRAFLLAHRNGDGPQGERLAGRDAAGERDGEGAPWYEPDRRGARQLGDSRGAGLEGRVHHAHPQGREDARGPAAGSGEPGGRHRGMAHADGQPLRDVEQRGPEGREGRVQDEGEAFAGGLRPTLRSEWPARPGERQCEWEAGRLTQPTVGRAVDGLPGRVDGSHNRAALKALGNAVVPQVAAAIGRAILTVERQMLTQASVSVSVSSEGGIR